MKIVLAAAVFFGMMTGVMAAPWSKHDPFAQEKASLSRDIEARFGATPEQADGLAHSFYAMVPGHLVNPEDWALLNRDAKNFAGTIEVSMTFAMTAAAVELCGYTAYRGGVPTDGALIRTLNRTYASAQLFEGGSIEPRRKERWNDIFTWQEQKAFQVVRHEGCGPSLASLVADFSKLP